MEGFKKKKFKFNTAHATKINLEEDNDEKMLKSPIKLLGSDNEVLAQNDHIVNKKPEDAQDNDEKEKKVEKNEEEDPLEAFMLEIESETKKQASEPSRGPRSLGMGEEQEDVMESFLKHRKKNINLIPAIKTNKEMDSDEEVYAMARAVDEQGDVEYDSNDEIVVKNKKDIEPLKPINHEEIEYLKIVKDIYKEHPDISNLAIDKVKEIRELYNIKVEGRDISKPCLVFGHFQFEDKLIDRVARSQYESPTPIQMQAVPIGLKGRDMIAIAQTGSGKTAAYLWPLINHVLKQSKKKDREGPIGIVLAPTHELAIQIGNEAKKYSKSYHFNVCIGCGGISKQQQFRELRSGADILVGTPGRVIDLIKMKAFSLYRTSFLVLDEADRMLDLGFEPQVVSIANNIRPDKQTLMFSATLPKSIEKLSRRLLNDPIKVTIGGVGMLHPDIIQEFEVLDEPHLKWSTLLKYLPNWLVNKYGVLIFVSTIMATQQLQASLVQMGYLCASIHGDLMQNERDEVLSKFKNGSVKILIATDVAARGLDVPIVQVVVNYDVAKDLDSHIHRIGRTGRAGSKGYALTMLVKSENHDQFMAHQFVTSFKKQSINVPSSLFAIAKRVITFLILTIVLMYSLEREN
ncbi:DEAD-domain-containing protein [Neoconidiobolus thromboides FSU 785]|nr:DEAD-domain-containing protein [Neoconidiobolus thromboides FSU 785]